jgi:elongation factor P--(R)-beta-lysine ligase
MGAKFRRQHPVRPYIVDFVCFECRLIIEVDGGQHLERAHTDHARDRALASRGFLVLRFWDNDVLLKTREVLEEIWAAAQKRRPSPQPLSRTRERVNTAQTRMMGNTPALCRCAREGEYRYRSR